MTILSYNLQQTEVLMRYVNEDLINNSTLGASENGEPFELTHLFGYSIQQNTSDAGTGSFDIEKSNDKVNWENVTTLAVPGGVDQKFYQESDVMYRWVRYKYTHTAGNVVAKLTINAKGV